MRIYRYVGSFLLEGSDRTGGNPSRRQTSEIRRFPVILSGEAAGIDCSTHEHSPGRSLSDLLLGYFFDLPYLFFNFADVVFGFTFNL
jgi:hypothetical protein